MIIYETINGLQIRYPEPDRKLARFLEKCRRVTDHRQLLALIFSEENPLMGQSPLGAMATRGTISHPTYRVMHDMVERRRLTPADLARISDGYTLTVADTAKRLGAHESTVRKAIREGRLASWVKDGQHYLHPKWTDQFRLATEKSRRKK